MSLTARAARLGSHAALALVTLVLAAELAVRSTPMPSLARATATSSLVTDRTGGILWGFLAEGDRWRLPATAREVDRTYLDLLLAYEDRRFEAHRGVDVLALLRAGWQWLRHGHAVSGASTITMQVVRLLEPQPRSVSGKVDQILKALRLERSLTKGQILDLYLTLAPFGGNLEGVRAASLSYFGKEPNRLGLGEAALLAIIPQSPEGRRPDRQSDTARRARNALVQASAARGTLSAAAATAATRAPMPAGLHPLTQLAPHLARRLRPLADATPDRVVRTLVDWALQRRIEAIATEAVRGWGEAVSLAVIVLRNRDSSVAAYLGGAELKSEDRRGFVDLVQAVRSPGSALKPLIYAMAFEKLLIHPETIITDQQVEIGGYRPDNADGQFAGDLSVRQALVRSRNTTAVMLLDKLGIQAFLGRFRSAGRPLLLPGSDGAAGLAVALGGVGVTLEQLTWFYTAFPNDGRLKPIRWRASDQIETLGPFLTPGAARATADILADVPPPPGFSRLRAADGGRRIGFKTGTSYGFRDAWAIGFDQWHTIGVWVGRADGAAHLGAYGATAAAPILMRVFDHLPIPPRDVSPARPDGLTLSSVRDLPDRLRRFGETRPDGAPQKLVIAFPQPGAELHVDRGGSPSVQLPVSLRGGLAPYTWTFNGEAQPSTLLQTMTWPIAGRGQFEVGVMDSTGASARSFFWLD